MVAVNRRGTVRIFTFQFLETDVDISSRGEFEN